ncbi:hypothetical protein CDL12_06214 [Handroanthus impetiginosus]|uniref:Uncharacterized protein n=1 Tax=Handroanthus impetiginosus TaxID=429701 RepID=A0A2G9HUU2_9LAMI|nr:hypothetical protein CDL12_06214 [Handroanthus impetiginosus]
MMLRQSSSRNLRSKSVKVKHALWIFVLLAICMWFLYQVKQSYNKKGELEHKHTQVLQNEENEYHIMKMGRKDLKPRLQEVAEAFEKHEDEEFEFEDDEMKVRENEGGENVDLDEEIDEGDKEKSDEVENDQLLDLIDEDDKDG